MPTTGVTSLSILAAALIGLAPAPAWSGEPTKAQIERGGYIFKLADCNGCHSVHDDSKLGWPVVPGGAGKGQVFPDTLGLPGTVVAPNITPDKETGIGTWTDAGKIRAIRDGVGREGKPLFPMMPSSFYRSMSDSDVVALVAYMNTLPPVKNVLPRTKLPPGMAFPSPPPAGSVPDPDRTNKVKYGEYLATLGACVDCHTPEAEGRPVESKRFAGGREFRFPGAVVVSANITPDPDTGIGSWTEQQFVARFRAYRQYAEKGSPAAGPEAFTIMPWLALSQATRDDLGAIHAYLKTIPPVSNKVQIRPGN